MKIETTDLPFFEIEADAIVVGLWDGPLTGLARELDGRLGGKLVKLIESEDVSAKRYSVTRLLVPDGVAAGMVLLVGLGSSTDLPAELAFRAAAAAARNLADRQRDSVAFYLDFAPLSDAVCGAMVGCVGQDLFRKEKDTHPMARTLWATEDESALEVGQILGDAVNLTRRLVNLPAADIYPETFADECEIVGQQADFSVEVWDEHRLEQEKCGALLAVARGSSRPPRLVIMRYEGGGSGQPTLGLVGKGVTFDSGGLSLKPSASMFDMKCDMAGAGTVVGAMQAIARLKLPVNVTGYAGLAENMISGDSYKLGDVLTSRNGKTIEIHNTDAEGRLVLADTLDVAIEQGVDHLVDLATLTGACVVALGRHIVGVMSNDDEWSQEVKDSAALAGEAVWSLPMFAEFSEQIKSGVADIKNVGDGRWGGAITAGKFLEEFVGETAWVHLDIAGPSFAEKPAAWVDAGASGVMVRTLVELARRYAQA